MPKITSIEKAKSKRGPKGFGVWYELLFDSGLSFLVNDELILKYLMKKGNDFTNNKIKAIRLEAEYQFLKKKAINILARRRYSEKELRRKLESDKKYAPHIDRVIDDFKKLGLIDDLQFAAGVIHRLLVSGARSKRYIRQKLYQKGVPREISEKAIDNELADYDEYRAALKLARKKYKMVRHQPQLKTKKRIADFLRGRGFEWDVINHVLTELLGEADQDGLL